jgi:AraC-like DNA-binding protein
LGNRGRRAVVDLSVLRKAVLGSSPLVEVATVTCTPARTTSVEPETDRALALVLVRRGSFRRRTNGREALLDATCGYVQRPGEEQVFSHSDERGDVCTVISFASEIAPGEAWEGGTALDRIPTETDVDLAHRQLIAACTEGIDGSELVEATLSLADRMLQSTAGRVTRRYRAAAERQRRLADAAREIMNIEPGTSLVSLARELGVSPRHLSRLFHEHIGMTLTDYRNVLRTRLAIEAIAAGAPSLARLAAELGFADQSHLTRTVRRLTGQPPSAHR